MARLLRFTFLSPFVVIVSVVRTTFTCYITRDFDTTLPSKSRAVYKMQCRKTDDVPNEAGKEKSRRAVVVIAAKQRCPLKIAIDLLLGVLVFLFLFTVSSAGGGTFKACNVTDGFSVVSVCHFGHSLSSLVGRCHGWELIRLERHANFATLQLREQRLCESK